MFEWLNDLARWIGNLFPRWDLLEPTDGGVKFKPGGKIVTLRPGRIYWWWPVTSVVYDINVQRQVLVFTQRLTTKDEVTVMVTTVVVYIIDDVQKALVKTRDFDDTVEEVAAKLSVQPVTSRTFAEVCADMADSNEMRNELTRRARSLLSEYGVGVKDAYIRDFAETRVISHDGEGFAITHEDYDE